MALPHSPSTRTNEAKHIQDIQDIFFGTATPVRKKTQKKKAEKREIHRDRRPAIIHTLIPTSGPLFFIAFANSPKYFPILDMVFTARNNS